MRKNFFTRGLTLEELSKIHFGEDFNKAAQMSIFVPFLYEGEAEKVKNAIKKTLNAGLFIDSSDSRIVRTDCGEILRSVYSRIDCENSFNVQMTIEEAIIINRNSKGIPKNFLENMKRCLISLIYKCADRIILDFSLGGENDSVIKEAKLIHDIFDPSRHSRTRS